MSHRSPAPHQHLDESEFQTVISSASRGPEKRLHGGDGGTPLKLSLRASELRYRRLFETAQDGILILDGNTGKIVDANPFLLHLLDYPFEKLFGRRLWDIGQFKNVAANHAAFEALRRNHYIRYKNRLRTKTGKEIPVEFVSNLYFIGRHKVIQCNIRDISARADVDESSCGRDAAFELASKSKDDVLALLSDELRTPLTSISCATDLLELGHDVTEALQKTDVPPEFDRSIVAVIRGRVRALLRLIDELLDLAYITNGTLRLELKTIDAHDVIRLAVKNLESWQKSKKVGIYIDLQARHSHILVDPGKLEQILSHLIGNALKFTPTGGRVLVVTRNERSGKLVIEVRDSGIGISPEALARIFLPFEQGDSSIHSRFGGLGLGLSIARALMEAQGAVLEGGSDGPGKGAKFAARFQLDHPPPKSGTMGRDL
jgi:PAS domain S-box-containing protein